LRQDITCHHNMATMIHNGRNGFAVIGCRKKNGSTYTAIRHLVYSRMKNVSQPQKGMKNDIAKNLLTTSSITLTIGRGAFGWRCSILYRRQLRAGISVIALHSGSLGLSKGQYRGRRKRKTGCYP